MRNPRACAMSAKGTRFVLGGMEASYDSYSMVVRRWRLRYLDDLDPKEAGRLRVAREYGNVENAGVAVLSTCEPGFQAPIDGGVSTLPENVVDSQRGASLA